MHILKPTRSILDPVHGLIRLTAEEVSVIDHPLFQRLRNVRQNGLLHLIFPSATHTRFEHSLGTLFTADALLTAIFENSTVTSAKETTGVASIESNLEGVAIDITAMNTATRAKLYRLTRLCGLVHDVGHGPLSHTFDSFAPRLATVRELASEAGNRALAKILARLTDLGPSDRRLSHEEVSCILFAIAWPGPEPVVLETSAALLGRKFYHLVVDSDLLPWIPFVHDILTSSPADADRMDYLERDSQSFGVSYGLFDRNRLLKSFLCYRSDVRGSPEFRLGIKRSGVRAVENFVQARFELFAQVYYHKTNRALELMLQEIATIGEGTVDLWQLSDLTGLVNRYIELTDEHFMKLLRGEARLDGVTVPTALQLMARAIGNRQLWKRVYDCRDLAEAKRLAAELASDFPDAPLHPDEVSAKATKGLKDGAWVLRRNADGLYAVSKRSGWTEESHIIAALAHEDSVSRVYLKQPDRALAVAIRNRAEELAGAA